MKKTVVFSLLCLALSAQVFAANANSREVYLTFPTPGSDDSWIVCHNFSLPRYSEIYLTTIKNPDVYRSGRCVWKQSDFDFGTYHASEFTTTHNDEIYALSLTRKSGLPFALGVVMPYHHIDIHQHWQIEGVHPISDDIVRLRNATGNILFLSHFKNPYSVVGGGSYSFLSYKGWLEQTFVRIVPVQ